MKKHFAVLMVIVVVFAIGAMAGPAFSMDKTVASRPDISLLQNLSTYVDPYSIKVDIKGLKKNFLPLLDLGKKSKVLYANFGLNTSGRYFSMVVEKKSKSGKTKGYFDVTFYVESHEKCYCGENADIVILRAYKGKAYGNLLTDNDLISIYALGRQDYLVNDENGNTTNSISLPEDKHWSPLHTSSVLINNGKSVGAILSEHLEAVETAGKGDEYTEKASWLHNLYKKDAKKSGRYLVWF